MTNKKMKSMALFFIIIMFGSSFAYAILNRIGGAGGRISIPKERILNYELNERQKSYLKSRGYTLVVYSSPIGCLECGSVKSNLEWMTQNSEGQIFLQEVSSNTNSSTLTVTSLKGERVLDNPSNQEIGSAICSLMLKREVWCVTSQI